MVMVSMIRQCKLTVTGKQHFMFVVMLHKFVSELPLCALQFPLQESDSPEG